MTNTARETVFRTLERALGRTRGPAAAIASPALPLPEPPEFDAAANELAAETERLGVGLQLAGDTNALQAALNVILARRKIKNAVVWDTPLLRDLGIRQMLGQAGVELPETDGTSQSLADVDLGVTTADGLLVETATLVLRADPGPDETRGRGYSLLPPIHLAIVPAANLLADVGDLPALLQHWTTTHPPHAVHLITGASSTADIEKILVKGVHGPMAVEVILLTPKFEQGKKE